MLVDANLLLLAVNRAADEHDRARLWLEFALNGDRPVGLPWQSLGAVLRIATHPRAFRQPLAAGQAWERMAEWLDAPAAWIPEPGPRYRQLLGGLIGAHGVRGNLVPDAMLAALALEHGLAVCSADADFARFAEVRWVNPLAG